MKSRIALKKVLVITSALVVATVMSGYTSGWTARQEAAHEIAERAREIGLGDGNPIIAECIRIWWAEEEAKAEKAESTESKAEILIPEIPVESLADFDEEEREISTEPEEVSTEPESLTETEPVYTYLGRYYITGYDTCYQCCGKTDGITASGAVATVGRTVAAAGFEFGMRLYIDGIGERVVEDRGPQSGDVIDVLCNNHDECCAITGWYDVYVLREDLV